MKRFISILLVIAMLACLVPQALLAPASAATMTLGQLKAKFPHNKYWNHRAESSHYAAACTTCNNPDGWTNYPCQHHDQSAVPVGDYDCNNFNKYGNSWQCAGFARKLAYDVYGNSCLSWTQVTSKDTAVSVVKPGDVIHYTGNGADATYGHWIMVIGVSGSTITIGECNWGLKDSDRCRINWGRTANINNFSTLTLYRAPSRLDTSESCTTHTWTSVSTVAATCTAQGYTNYKCSVCGATKTDSYTAALGHSLSWTVTKSATCTSTGEKKATCTRSGCSHTETASVSALGHDMKTELIPATCQQAAATRHYCARSGCSYSYTEYDESGYSAWSTEYPSGVSESLIRSRTEYRYSDHETSTGSSSSKSGWTMTGSSWVKSSSGTIDYVPNWSITTNTFSGVGIDTSSSLYKTYDKSIKSASETATAKTTVSSSHIGYIYYHWCRGTYTSGPINRLSYENSTGAFTAFHGFYSAGTTPASKYDPNGVDGLDGYYYSNADVCRDSYWYYAIPVYRQTWTSYTKQYSFERWTDWSDWSTEKVSASDSRKVETRTVYSYLTATGDHVWDQGTVVTPSTCVKEGESKYTCTLCGATKLEPLAKSDHTYTEQVDAGNCVEPSSVIHTCTVCGYSYKSYAEDAYTDWAEEYPTGVKDELIRSRTEYRYSDYETSTGSSSSKSGWTQTGSKWIKNSTGEMDYVPSWYMSFSDYTGVGIDTSNSVYQKYNKTAVSASESSSKKVEVNSNAIVGYVYYHWCRGNTYSAPQNKYVYAGKTTNDNGTFNTCHAFYGAGELAGKYDPNNRHGDDAYYYPNASCCLDSYWFFAVPVYHQTWTTYDKEYSFERWTDWSDWSADEVTPTDTRKVETRTVYSYVKALGEHVWGDWQTSEEATCTEAGTKTRTCSVCGETENETIPANGHHWDAEEHYCTVCSAENPDYIALAVKVESAVLETENTVTVPITISGNSGFAGFTFCIECDEALTLTGASRGALLNTSDSGSFVKNISGKTVTWHDIEDLTADGILFTLTFKLNENASVGSYHVGIRLKDGLASNFVDKDSQNVALRFVDGTITLREHTHSYTAAVTTPADCTTDGVMTYTCSCGDSYSESIPALGHEYKYNVVAPTCTAEGYTQVTCERCDYSDMTDIKEALGHSNYQYTDNGDGTHKVTCGVCSGVITASEAHAYVDGTCPCGAKEGPTVIEGMTINHTLDLSADISVMFVVRKTLVADYDLDSMYFECSYDKYSGNTVSETITRKIYATDRGTYWYFTFSGLSALEMGNDITAVLHLTKDGQEYIVNDTYSVATYAYSQLNKSNASDTTKATCANLLRYGSAAQIFKNTRTDALVDANMTDAHRAYLTDLSTVEIANNYRVLDDLTDASVTWVGKTFQMNTRVELKFVFSLAKFTGDQSNLSLHVSYEDYKGVAQTVVVPNSAMTVYNAKNSSYAFNVDSLKSADMRDILSVAVYEGETQVSPTMQYSVESYGYGKTGQTLTVCQALLAYSDAAKAQFG